MGTLDASKTQTGTFTVARIPLGVPPTGTVNIVTNTKGSLPINTRATGTLAASRTQTLPNLVGTLPLATKTSGSLNVNTRAFGTLAASRTQALTALVGTLPIVSKTSGSLPINTRAMGTLAASRTQTLQNLVGTLPINTKASGTLPITTKTSGSLPVNTRATGTLAATRVPTLPSLVGTISVATKTSGTLPINTRASGTLAASRTQTLPNLVGTLPAAKLATGTFASENVSVQKVGTLTLRTTMNSGTVPSVRVSTGTLGVPRIPLLSSIPGTISIVSKTSGSLPINTRATGTLAAQRHPLLQNLAGTISVKTKTSGTLPTTRGFPSDIDNPAWFDDFFWTPALGGAAGELAWTGITNNGPGPVIVLNPPDNRKSHPGIIQLSTANTSGGGIGLYTSNAGAFATGAAMAASETFDATAGVKGASGAGKTGSFMFKFGFAGSVTAIPSSRNAAPIAVWRVNSASPQKWQTMTGTGLTMQLNTGTTYAAGTWYKLRIRRTTVGSIEFSMNGVVAFTHGGNSPNTGTLSPHFYVVGKTGTTKAVSLDYFYMTLSGLGR